METFKTIFSSLITLTLALTLSVSLTSLAATPTPTPSTSFTSSASSTERMEVFNDVQLELISRNFTIASKNETRPWGGFFVIDESQAQEFADAYFEGMNVEELKISGKLSPRILVIAPHKRLSWQYHHRRAEIWRILSGHVGVITSNTDEEGELMECKPGDLICISQGQRHRLVGLKNWAVVAEIWQHTDNQNPSDENDIVRLQDDFGR